LSSISELGANGGEGKDHVEAILHTVQEVVPELGGRRILTLGADVLHPDVLALKGNDVLVFFGNQTRDFTSGEHGVDGFEEGLLLNLGIGHDEGNLLTLWASKLIKLTDVILKVTIVVSLRQGDLEEDILANESSKLGKRLLSRTTDTNKQGVTTGHVDDTGKSEKMTKSVVEENKVHLLGRVLLVVEDELLFSLGADAVKVGTRLVNERSFLNEFIVLVIDVITLEDCESIVGDQLLVIKVETVTEDILGHAIEVVHECFLVCQVSELIVEDTLTLVAPQSDKEKLGLDFFLDVEAVLDDLELRLQANTTDTLEYTRELANGEGIVELGGRRQELLADLCPDFNGTLN